MSKELAESSLLDLVPDSIAKDPDVSASARSLDVPLRETTGVLDLPSIYVSIDKLTSDQLDHLAYSWDASVWRDSWPLRLKRSVLKNVICEKRKKGTLRAVKDAVSSLGSASTITEWWQMTPKGEAHTFTIQANLEDFEGTINSEMQEDLFALIDDAKPVRSHYKFVLLRQLGGTVGVSGTMRPAVYARIRSEKIRKLVCETGLQTGLRPVVSARLRF